jgi:hypothetical protein
MAKIELVDFQSEQGFDLVLKRTVGRAQPKTQNLNSILISFTHGREENCQVSRCLNYPHFGDYGMLATAERHAARPLRGVPAAKPWRPCKSARQNGK